MYRNGKMSHVPGLKEIIFLNCPYYPKHSTDLFNPLSKYSLHFLNRTRTNNLKSYM